MPIYEVVMAGLLRNKTTGHYNPDWEYEDYIEYNGTSSELAAEILKELHEQGYELVRTKEMRDEDIDRIRIGIRGEF